MELDDLKRSWQRYDKRLTDSLKMNEEILRRSNLDRSRREMNTPLNVEMISVVINAVFAVFILSATIRYGSEVKYLISGLVTILYMGLDLAASHRKIKMLNRIDYYNGAVVDLQKRLHTFQAFYTRVRKWELYFIPVVFLFVFPVFMRAIHGFDIMAYPKVYALDMLIVLALTYPLILWIYRNWYDKRVKAANQFLSELQEFEKEE